MLCRDRCGYCTFAQPPARLDSPYLSPGRGAGHRPCRCPRRAATRRCSPWASGPRTALPGGGRVAGRSTATPRRSTTWPPCAALVLDETGLLPHANAGALSADELALLRTVSPSQGMMIESLNPDLDCHRGCPGQDARAPPGHARGRRRAAASRSPPASSSASASPGRTGSTPWRRSPASHRRHGHVQEVIVQNFLPKDGTAMHLAPPCPRDEYLDAIALARLILPPEIHLQAPPNLSDDFGVLLDAGIDDWGGVSPVTARPRQPRATLARPRPPARGDRGPRLRPRPPPDDLPGVRARPRALARRRPALPGAWTAPTPRASAATTRARCSRRRSAAITDGRRRRRGDTSIGHRSTPGTPGAGVTPPVLVPAPSDRASGAPWPRCSTACWPARRSGDDEIVTLFSRPRARGGRGGRGRRRTAPARPSATPSPSSATATSTTRTCAPSSAGSAGSPRGR